MPEQCGAREQKTGEMKKNTKWGYMSEKEERVKYGEITRGEQRSHQTFIIYVAFSLPLAHPLQGSVQTFLNCSEARIIGQEMFSFRKGEGAQAHPVASSILHSNHGHIMLQNPPASVPPRPTKKEELAPMQPHKHASVITVCSAASISTLCRHMKLWRS